MNVCECVYLCMYVCVLGVLGVISLGAQLTGMDLTWSGKGKFLRQREELFLQSGNPSTEQSLALNWKAPRVSFRKWSQVTWDLPNA